MATYRFKVYYDDDIEANSEEEAIEEFYNSFDVSSNLDIEKVDDDG